MKISLIRMAIACVITVSMGACSSMQGSGDGDESAEATKPAFEEAYQAAESAYNRAKASNNLWVNTEEQMDKAKEAAGKGDFATAIKLAKRAKFESDAAYEQAESEKDIKPWLF